MVTYPKDFKLWQHTVRFKYGYSTIFSGSVSIKFILFKMYNDVVYNKFYVYTYYSVRNFNDNMNTP